MRKSILLFILFISAIARGQNLVPNGSFEQYVTCPYPGGLIWGCAGWSPFGSIVPYYFNSCNVSSNYGVPGNTFGNENAASGYAYAGLYTYTSSIVDAKEYIIHSMQPMTIGTTYEVSMSVSLADNSGYGSDDLGIHFFDAGPTYIPTPYVLPITPKVSFASMGPVTTKKGWKRLSKTFVADSTYDNIVIGGFRPYSSMVLAPAPPGNFCYYYIDSVVVRQIRMRIIYTDTLLCAGDSITVPYNTYTSSGFGSGNQFSLLLSDGNGDFGNSTVLGSSVALSGTFRVRIPPATASGTSYRLKLMSTMPLDSSSDNGNDIHINAKPIPVATINSPLCEGDTLKLAVSSAVPVDPGNGYMWYGGAMVGTVGNPIIIKGVTMSYAGDYYVRASNQGCIEWDTVSLVVKEIPKNVKGTINTPLCEGETLMLTGSTNTPGVNYKWTGPGSFTSASKDTSRSAMNMNDAGKYVFTATLNGCSAADSLSVVVLERPKPQITTNSPVCDGDSLVMESTETVPGETYVWTGMQGFSATQRRAGLTHTGMGAAGKYIVTVTSNGCIGIDTTEVVVKELPAKPVGSSNSPVCEGDTLHLYINTIIPGVNYQWSGPKGFTANIPAIINAPLPDASGSYRITATANGCYQYDNINVLVKPLPEKPIIVTNSPLQTGQNLFINIKNPQQGVLYSWTGPNGFQSQSSSPMLNKPNISYTGSYFVLATLNGCTNSSVAYVQIDASVDTGYVLLYPSINEGDFSIRALLRAEQQVWYRIFDAMGREVYNGLFKTQNKYLKEEILLKNYLADGMYMMHIIADGKKQVLRFVVNKQ